MKVTELREYDHGIVIVLDDKFEISLGWTDINYYDSYKDSLVRQLTGKTASEHYDIARRSYPWPISVNCTSRGPRSYRF